MPSNRSPRAAWRATASAVLLAVIAGCGGGGTADPTSTAQDVASTPAAAASIAAAPVPVASATATPATATPATAAAASTATDAATADVAATDAEARATAQAVKAATAATTPVATGGGKTYLVGGTAPLVTGSTRVATMMAVPWSSLPAGSVVLVAAGAYSGVTTITSVGTAANPIVVTAADPTHPPVLTNSVDFQNAAYVQVSHVIVQSPTYDGFIIRLGSRYITVSDNTIDKAPAGIMITQAAGIGHQVLRNTIADSVIDGIGVDVNSDATVRTLIQDNTIVRSGQHGIELRASYYRVEYNTVTASGQANTGGTSGIHVYRGSPSENSGQSNWVRYNLSYANTDKVAADGNGIEIDQWCSSNTVSYNQVWGNDGAGIIVYDGSDNLVQNNTAWNDAVNSGGTHVGSAEIAITGTSPTTVKGNHVWNNLMFSTRAGAPALYVDTRAVAGVNTIGANMYWNSAAGTLLRWTDAATRQTAALIDTTTGTAGNLVAAPAFKNAVWAITGGLALVATPTLHGVIPTGQLDAANALPTSTDAYFGAFYKAP